MEGASIPGHLQEKGNTSQPTLDHDVKIEQVYLHQEFIIQGQGKGTGAGKLLNRGATWSELDPLEKLVSVHFLVRWVRKEFKGLKILVKVELKC